MIRKHVGNELFLIAQDDHATVAGQLAAQFGGGEFQRTSPAVVRGTSLHDCGWPLHDDQPTLNSKGLPRDVFETPPEIGLRVWSASADRAAEEDPYAGLLVSLHSMSLSVLATNPTAIVHEKFDMDDAATRFEINRFQQRQVELQEQLRRELGMRTDEPRRFGLAENSQDPREKQLIFDFRLLQGMDKLSLAICCTKPPIPVIEPLPASPASKPQALHVAAVSIGELEVHPWCFTSERLTVRVPFRRFAAAPQTDATTFQKLYAKTRVEELECTVHPRV